MDFTVNWTTVKKTSVGPRFAECINLLECSTMIIQTVWRLHRQQAARVYKAVAVAMLAGKIGKEAIVTLERLHWTPSVCAWVMPKRQGRGKLMIKRKEIIWA